MRFLYKYKRFSQYLIEVMTGFYEIVYLEYDVKKAENVFLCKNRAAIKYELMNKIRNDKIGYCNWCLSIQLFENHLDLYFNPKVICSRDTRKKRKRSVRSCKVIKSSYNLF